MEELKLDGWRCLREENQVCGVQGKFIFLSQPSNFIKMHFKNLKVGLNHKGSKDSS